MARKKRKKEEEYHFKMPEFDEVEFMRKEVEGAKAAIATIAYALLVGLLSYYLTLLGVALIAVPLGFIALYGLKYIYPLLKLDISKFDRKSWVGNGAIFLFAWLAFWVLLLNPPFLDISPPVVHQAKIDGASPEVLGNLGQAVLPLGGNSSFEFLVLATDNVQVVRVELRVNGGEWREMDPTGDNGWFSATVDVAEKGLHRIEVRAVDHQKMESDVFRVDVNVT
ncbi:MAG: hypothetical protein ACE5HJ_08750 [Thermoplasmata archaeon]